MTATVSSNIIFLVTISSVSSRNTVAKNKSYLMASTNKAHLYDDVLSKYPTGALNTDSII